MELVGEEKRIQALFSEVKLADEQTTPSFAGVWFRAQSKTVRRPRAFNLLFVAAATGLLVCVLVSLGWWSKHRQQDPDVVATAPRGLATSPVRVGLENEEVNLPKPMSKGKSRGAKSRALKLAARRDVLLVANRRAARVAKTIASWQSPTATLLDSQIDELLKALPQLNQTANELKSFLPSEPK